MKFYDTGNAYNSLVHYVNDLLGLPTADVAYYTLAQKARATNTYKYKLALMLMKADAAWSWEDNVHTDLPIATADLVDGQRDYTIPAYAIGLERIEIKNNDGNYYQIPIIDETDVKGALTGYGESNGTPERAWVRGRSIFLDPAPDANSVTLTAGIKIYFPREVNEFTAATTTTEVGFDEPGDRAVAFMVAEEFAGTHPGFEPQLSFIQFQLYGGVKNGKPVEGMIDLILNRQGSNRLKDAMKPGLRIKVEDME